MVIRERFSYKGIHQVLSGLLGEDLHAKRVSSLCDATLGVLHSGSLAICAIGQGLAAARSLKPKHAVKQIDRLLSNTAINVDDILFRWVPFIIGERSSIMVAMDWTDFDADNQATIMLALMSDHGRSTPLVWLSTRARSRIAATSMSIACWYGLPSCCLRRLKCASLRIAASATKNFTKC
jgi:hypothetical protein